MVRAARGSLVDLRNVDAVRARRPLVVAHRGGVITPTSPENSLAAIRLAALYGYDMVELDVVKPRDDEPVLFHDGSGRLSRNCGVDVRLAEHTAEELAAFRYRASDEPIATLAQALALCRELHLGVMLDVKEAYGDALTPGFVGRVRDLLREHGMTSAAVTISHHPLVREMLAEDVLFRVERDDDPHIPPAGGPSLAGKFWFGLPEHLLDAAVPALQQAGALVLPAVNTFRYPPHAHAALAHEDIERLGAAAVDGFQIDSVYGTLLGLREPQD